MRTLKAYRLAFIANINYLLSHLGYEASPDGTDHLVNTKLGAIHFWIPPFNDDLHYRLNGEPQSRPSDDDPIFYLLKDEYNSDLNWFKFFRKEADLDCLRSWEVAYESMARKLCHLIHGHITTATGLVAEGRVEDFLPDSGHVLVGQKKMTVGRFKKKYYVALGNECRLFFDRRVVLEHVAWSLFSLEDVQELTIIAK